MSAIEETVLAAGPLDARRSPYGRLRPLAFGAAAIEDGFWAARQKLNRDVLIPDGAQRLEEAGNLPNIRAAAGLEPGPYQGPVYMDSDLHKWLEAVGWELGRRPSDALAARVDAMIEAVAAAQDDDGYLNSCYQLTRARGERLTELAWDHELYCGGHLIQAGIAHARGRGERRLLEVARRFADHVDGVFGPGRRAGTCGHPEIETALVELHRLTGERRYLRLAGFFIDQRGHGRLQPTHFGAEYFQDHLPVREQTEISGHAVRALYLGAGVMDLYLETGEARLLDVMTAQWDDMAGRKTYLTGAVGAREHGEAFGDPFELPPDSCYGETCASIASIQLGWRMLVATGEARYADLIERTLYNGFAAGVALDGSGYFYVNPLEVHDGETRRQPRYGCACCPPNVMRLLATLHHYLATADDDGLQIHQYASGVLRGDGSAVRVTTEYPWDGRVAVEILETGDAAWTLSLRVPAWCTGADVDGEAAPAGEYVRLRRSWRPGDVVTLSLPMLPRITEPDPRIDAVRGRVAIERGPLVYCLEDADAPVGAGVGDVVAVDAAAPLRDAVRPDLLGGIVAVEIGEPDPLLAVPYCLWGNRRVGAMRVWLPSRRARDCTVPPGLGNSV